MGEDEEMVKGNTLVDKGASLEAGRRSKLQVPPQYVKTEVGYGASHEQLGSAGIS